MKRRLPNLIKNPYFIISLLGIFLFSLFILHSFSTNNLILPSVQSISVFCFSVVFLFLAYILLKKSGESKKIFAIIFLVTLLFEIIIFISMPLNTDKWVDVRGYYNLALFTKEKDPLYLVQNYHRLASWNQSFCPDAKIRLEKLVENKMVLEYIKNKLQIDNPLDLSEYNFYHYSPDRAGMHPLGWILILYFFIALFGSYEIVAIMAEFILAAFLVTVVYWFLRKNTNFNNALTLTFLFILTPAFIIYSVSPLMDVPLAIFIILTLQFYSEYMQKHKKIYLFLSSLLFSVAMLIKFVSFFFFLPILIITIIKRNNIKNFLFFAIISILPLTLLSIFNYYYFLNLLSSFIFTSCSQVGPNWLYFLSHFPKEIVALFSLPILYMISVGTIKILFKKKKTEKEKIMLLYIISFLIFSFFIGQAISRLIFMFSPILLFVATNQLKSFKIRFVCFCFIISSIQLLILMILNILNV
ncbi:MAG: hypothetical protein A2Y66_02190 [Nitrospirae bacterium RBG_13_41_22]|nr:MAG: hypothetical protein A2Y66_02190 [Nitrospirae bacterium RBG_13_41_22]